MTYPSLNHQNAQDVCDQYHQELIDDILLHDAIYPWDFQDTDTEDYINYFEHQFTQIWSEQELQARSEKFFHRLDQCWNVSASANPYEILMAKLDQVIPQDWLEYLLSQVDQMKTLNLQPMDKLIKCVQPLLEQWSEVDLRVFARPLVYAMRGDCQSPPAQMIDSMIHNKLWTDLSEIEKAKITLAIAQSILELS